jgi:hypothetical protein
MKSGHRALLIGIAPVLLLVGCGRQTPSEPDEDRGAAPGEKPARVEVRDLFNKYVSDAAGADREFKGKLVSLRGRVNKAGKTTGENQRCVYLTTMGGEKTINVVCLFDAGADEQTLDKLSRGEAITVAGRVAGKQQGAIAVRHCKITEGPRGKNID